ncbi:MAG: hypothetical protein HYY04_05175 [Chloroflexi bacterium]|nr:hypothetical protein [Chloroflexota bacterium]
MSTPQAGTLTLVIALALLLGACGPRAGLAPRSVPVPTAPPALRPAPASIVFPRDDAPHDNLTEWWYYTGHLTTATGDRYGFEFVIFQSIRGRSPVVYVAHFAITDHQARRFAYDQRTVLGSPGRPASPPHSLSRAVGEGGGAPLPWATGPTQERRAQGVRPAPPHTEGFDLALDGWTMRGANGHDALVASLPGYALDLRLTATKPPALHGGLGWISFGPAGDSYYYSRTRLDVQGSIRVGDARVPVTGLAWMDHQWGDFLSVGGGWDWYSVHLDDGSELTLSVVRDDTGREVLAFGTVVDASGRAEHLRAREFEATATGSWESPHTGARYPSGWALRIDRLRLNLTLAPVLLDQELDTRATTRVAYWEGEVDVRGQRDGRPVAGHGYVELTGYATAR